MIIYQIYKNDGTLVTKVRGTDALQSGGSFFIVYNETYVAGFNSIDFYFHSEEQLEESIAEENIKIDGIKPSKSIGSILNNKESCQVIIQLFNKLQIDNFEFINQPIIEYKNRTIILETIYFDGLEDYIIKNKEKMFFVKFDDLPQILTGTSKIRIGCV